MRITAGTYETNSGGLIILKGDSLWWTNAEHLDPMTIVRWSNTWPRGDVAQLHLRVWRKWWVRVV